MSLPTLRRNVSWIAMGEIGYSAAMWGVLMVLTRAGPEVVGAFALSVAIASPLFQFTNLNLRVVIATDARSEQDFGVYVAQRILSTSIALLGIAAILALTDYSSDVVLIVWLVALGKVVASFSDVLYGLSQQRERMDHIGISKLLRGPVMLPVFAGSMWLTGSLATSLAVQYLIWTVVLVFYDIPRGTSLLNGMRGLIPIWDGARVLRLTRQAAPLGLVVLASALVESTPLYFIEYYYGVAALGIFATLAYFIKVGGVLVKSVIQGFVPRMAKHFVEREQREFWKLVGWTVVYSLVLGGVGLVAASLWGAPILHLLYGAEYAAHTGLLVVIMLAGAIAYLTWVANNTLNTMRLFGRQVPLAGSVLLMNLIACVLVVPKYGTAGAAWAWVATGCFHLLLASVMVWFANRSFLQDA